MQKLETEPEIEVENQCRAFDALRTSEGDWNEEYFQAWAAGKTGFPMVDACMRCLLRSGWMNFRYADHICVDHCCFACSNVFTHESPLFISLVPRRWLTNLSRFAA